MSHARRSSRMGKSTATVPLFCKYIWQQMPVRREAVDQESIFDCVLVAIQHWPVEKLSQAEPMTIEEADCLADVAMDVHRVLSCVYGEERWEGYRIIGIDVLLPELLAVMCHWWRRRKDNRGKIILWRRKWVPNDE